MMSFWFIAGTSVNFYSPIYPSDKCISCQEPNRTSKQSVHQTSQETVREEEHGAHEAGDMQDVGVIVDAVRKDPNAGCTAEEERLPPPMVIL